MAKSNTTKAPKKVDHKAGLVKDLKSAVVHYMALYKESNETVMVYKVRAQELERIIKRIG